MFQQSNFTKLIEYCSFKFNTKIVLLSLHQTMMNKLFFPTKYGCTCKKKGTMSFTCGKNVPLCNNNSSCILRQNYNRDFSFLSETRNPVARI